MSITQRIQRGSEALFELTSAEINRGVIAVKTAGKRIAVRMVGLVFATFGAIGVAVAIIIALTPHLGLMWSTLLISAIIILIGTAICFVAGAGNRETTSAATNQASIEAAKAKLSMAFDPPPADPSTAGGADADPSLKEQLEAALADPRVLTGAAFAAMSIIGPFRLLKLATRSAGAATAIAALASAVKSSRVKPPQH